MRRSEPGGPASAPHARSRAPFRRTTSLDRIDSDASPGKSTIPAARCKFYRCAGKEIRFVESTEGQPNRIRRWFTALAVTPSGLPCQIAEALYRRPFFLPRLSDGCTVGRCTCEVPNCGRCLRVVSRKQSSLDKPFEARMRNCWSLRIREFPEWIPDDSAQPQGHSLARVLLPLDRRSHSPNVGFLPKYSKQRAKASRCCSPSSRNSTPQM